MCPSCPVSSSEVGGDAHGTNTQVPLCIQPSVRFFLMSLQVRKWAARERAAPALSPEPLQLSCDALPSLSGWLGCLPSPGELGLREQAHGPSPALGRPVLGVCGQRPWHCLFLWSLELVCLVGSLPSPGPAGCCECYLKSRLCPAPPPLFIFLIFARPVFAAGQEAGCLLGDSQEGGQPVNRRLVVWY